MNSRLEHIPHSDHYDSRYVEFRLDSVVSQCRAILNFAPRNVLEVGPGGGVVTRLMRGLGVVVTTLDVEKSVRPDVVASVTEIPVPDMSFDGALCCQVLEHLPFERFVSALAELRRVCRRWLVLSLPDKTRYLELSLYLPRAHRCRFALDLPLWPPRPCPPERLEAYGHHWEIGYSGTPLKAVMRAIGAAQWNVLETWRVPELPWHRFFVAERSP